MKSFLRWVILIPAVFCGAEIVKRVNQAGWKWALMNDFFLDPNGTTATYISMFFGNILTGVAVVFLSYWIAPAFKRNTSFVFTVINVLSSVVLILYSFYTRSNYMFLILFFYSVNICSTVFSMITVIEIEKQKAPE